MNNKNEVKEAIKSTLAETKAELTKELVQLCQGILKINLENKEVRVESSSSLTEKEQIALYCLGQFLLAYVDETVPYEASWKELEKKLGIEAKKISAYASVLKDEGLLESGSRGSYKVRLAKMHDFVKAIRRKLKL